MFEAHKVDHKLIKLFHIHKGRLNHLSFTSRQLSLGRRSSMYRRWSTEYKWSTGRWSFTGRMVC